MSKEVLALQGGKVGDLAYVMDTEVDGCKTHVQTAAIDKEQGLQYFANKFELDNERHLGQVSHDDEVKDLVQYKAEAEDVLRETYAKVAYQYKRLAN